MANFRTLPPPIHVRPKPSDEAKEPLPHPAEADKEPLDLERVVWDPDYRARVRDRLDRDDGARKKTG